MISNRADTEKRRELPLALTTSMLVAALFIVSRATAATVTFVLVHDPEAPNNGCVGCTLTGPGTWDLYALSSFGDNFGIASYQSTLENTTSIIHRSPRTNLVPDPNPDELDPVGVGFQQLRSADGANPIHAGQDIFIPDYFIRGFGQTASNFAAEFPGTVQSGPSNQNAAAGWGAALLIAEGTYGGTLPSFGDVNTVVVFDHAAGPNLSFANVDTLVLTGGGTNPEPSSALCAAIATVTMACASRRRRVR
jgi:hypothetical protein